MINVLVRLTYDGCADHLEFDDSEDIVFFSDKYLPQMNELLEEFNKETKKTLGEEQYRIFSRFEKVVTE